MTSCDEQTAERVVISVKLPAIG